MNDYILEILYKKQLESPSCMLSAMIVAFEYTRGLEGIRYYRYEGDEGIPIGNEIWLDVYNSAFNYYCRINEKFQKIINERR